MAEDFSFEKAKFLYLKLYLNILNKKRFKIFLFVIYFSFILCLMKLNAKIQIGSTTLYDVNLTKIKFNLEKIRLVILLS
jgi:hypothetical protein